MKKFEDLQRKRRLKGMLGAIIAARSSEHDPWQRRTCRLRQFQNRRLRAGRLRDYYRKPEDLEEECWFC